MALLGVCPSTDAGSNWRKLRIFAIIAASVDAQQLYHILEPRITWFYACWSILPLTRREKCDWPDDVFIQISESHVGRAIRTRRWKYAVVADGKDGNRDAGSDQYAESFLYDLQTDPYELTNLIGLKSHDDLVVRLRQRLLSRMQQAGESASQIIPAPSKPAGQRKVLVSEIDS